MLPDDANCNALRTAGPAKNAKTEHPDRGHLSRIDGGHYLDQEFVNTHFRVPRLPLLAGTGIQVATLFLHRSFRAAWADTDV